MPGRELVAMGPSFGRVPNAIVLWDMSRDKSSWGVLRNSAGVETCPAAPGITEGTSQQSARHGKRRNGRRCDAFPET